MLGREEIALADEVEHRLLMPLRRLEPAIAGLCLGLDIGLGMGGIDEALP